MRPLSITSLVVLTFLAVTLPAHAQTTSLFLDSEPGDFVGHGARILYTTADATFQVDRNFDNEVSLRAVASNGTDFWWFLDFSATQAVPLAVGSYTGARRFPFARFNGLNVSGSSGACNTLTGRYLVREIEYLGTAIVRFAADFEQHCEDAGPALFGSIRYNSTIADLLPFGGEYPRYRLSVASLVNGRVTGAASGVGLDCGAAAACALELPGAGQFPLVATPDPGYVFGGWTGDCYGGPDTTVHVNGPMSCSATFLPVVPTSPRTLFSWTSQQGDYIGQGQSGVYAPWNSRWTLSMPSPDRLEIRIVSNDGPYGADWTLNFAAPTGQVLQSGVTYQLVRRFASETNARLDIFGSGRGCNQTLGEFRIRELVPGPGSIVVRAAVDFTQHCELATAPPLTGVLQYDSTVDMPSMTLDKSSLQFAVIPVSLRFVPVPVLVGTGDQTVRLTQSGAGTVSWTATSSHPSVVITPASGIGSATLSIGIRRDPFPWGLTSGTGTITFAFTGTTSAPGPIVVTLLVSPGAETLGVIDTPLDHSTGVAGSVSFTGWALDTFEVERVTICRLAVIGETAPIDPRCATQAQVYVGDATFIDGARPDVQAAHPAFPRSSRGGWGFMVLTNSLPNQGNGTFVFYAYAYGVPIAAPFGPWTPRPTLLGTRTMTCANASATKPFGAIDTPTQGGTASGAGFVNFGWALTPQPKLIPLNGSTITVLVDGASIGTVNYNHERPDIETLFPGFQNTAGTNGAIGFRVIDTTALTNGLHTISWTVVDNQGAIEGIGSRFFTVSNGAAAVTAAPLAVTRATDVATAPRDEAPVLGRRGWDLEAPWRWYGVGGSGRAVIRGEEIDRVEVWLGAPPEAHYTGHLRVGDGLAPLPVGSQLDAATGWFTWAPGVGFVGSYDLVFVRWAGARAVARHEVRVILAPKGRGHVGVQVAIDTPRSQQDVGQPFVLAGWAADLDAATTTGIDTLHVWAYPLAGGAPVFLGTPTLGAARPDVAAIHGDQFRATGFTLAVQGLTPGIYDLAVFPWSNVTGAFAPPQLVHVTVR